MNNVTIPYMNPGISLDYGSPVPEKLQVNIQQLERLLVVAKAKAEAARVPSVELVLGCDAHFRIGTVVLVEKRFETHGQMYTYVAAKVNANYWISSAKTVDSSGTFGQVFGGIWKDAAYIAVSVSMTMTKRSEFPKQAMAF